MFFRRDPYYGYSPAAGCFGSLLAFLVIATILIVCAIYIGTYVLLVLLVLGTIIGGLTAIFALLKALPQTARDMSCQIYQGNKIVILLKKTGYFFICLIKYSVSNDLQIAQNAYKKFDSKKVLSFSKWINLALSVTVLIFGLLILVAILFFAILIVASLIALIISVSIAVIVTMLGVSMLWNLFLVAKKAVQCGIKNFSPICFKFAGKCVFMDLLLIPRMLLSQIRKWVSATWKSSMNLISSYKSWINTMSSIFFPWSIAMIISCPISTTLIIAAILLIIIVLSVIVYLIDAVWILMKAVFKF